MNRSNALTDWLIDKGTPVLCTTATANTKVVEDIAGLFGGDWKVQRGSLLRESLHLHNIAIADKAARLAWLAENIPRLPGSGVVYVNSKPDADVIADWLRFRGITARAYYAGVMPSNEVWNFCDSFYPTRLCVLLMVAPINDQSRYLLLKILPIKSQVILIFALVLSPMLSIRPNQLLFSRNDSCLYMLQYSILL